MKVTRQIVTDLSNTYGGGNPEDYITIHETANTNNGADAEAHADLQSGGNSRDASWHYSVDDHSAYQSFEEDIQCWHAGDGQGPGNLKSIAIEICVNKDGNFHQAVMNAAELTAQIMEANGIPIGNVVQHNKWSGKNCPTYLRNGSKGINWADFIALVKENLNGNGSGSTTPPKPPTGDIDVDGYWGEQTTFALQKAFGTPEDGIVSQQPISQEPKNPGLGDGWDWTHDSTPNGSTVIRAMQEQLKDEGYYSDDIDGLCGPNTIKGLQKHFGTHVDGFISAPSSVVKAMQKRLNQLVSL